MFRVNIAGVSLLNAKCEDVIPGTWTANMAGLEHTGAISKGSCMCTAGTHDEYVSSDCALHDNVNETQTALANTTHPVHAQLLQSHKQVVKLETPVPTFPPSTTPSFSPTSTPTESKEMPTVPLWSTPSLSPTDNPTTEATETPTTKPTFTAATAAPTASVPAAPIIPQAGDDSGHEKSLAGTKTDTSGSNHMRIVGIAVGAGLALVALIAALILYVQRRRQTSLLKKEDILSLNSSNLDLDAGEKLAVTNPGAPVHTIEPEAHVPTVVKQLIVEEKHVEVVEEQEEVVCWPPPVNMEFMIEDDEEDIRLTCDDISGKKIQILGRGVGTVKGVEKGDLEVGVRRRHSIVLDDGGRETFVCLKHGENDENGTGEFFHTMDEWVTLAQDGLNQHK
jgi:hypothetical protein